MRTYYLVMKIFFTIFLLIYITQAQTGFVMGELGTLVKTTDGGQNWSIKPTGTSITLWESYFINDNTGWIAEGNVESPPGIIIKTTDQGESWVTQYTSNTCWFTNVWFLNNQTGYAVGSSQKVIKTTNGGTNWDFITMGSGSTELETVFFPDSATGYITGWGGLLYKSTDAGNSWFSVISGTGNNLYASYFLNYNFGIVAGAGGTILRTLDGNNWVSQPSGTTSQIFSVYFYNKAYGWAVGDNGTVVKSTDRGDTWFPLNSGTTIRLEIVAFVNQMTGWIAGGWTGSIVKKTVDGGNNWVTQNVGSNNRFYSAWFFRQPLIIESESNKIPTEFNLYQNYPNPFNPTTRIKFDLPYYAYIGDQNVQLVVLDITGREIATLLNEKLNPGSYEVQWDASNYSSGIYFYTLRTNKFIQTQKMILVK